MEESNNFAARVVSILATNSVLDDYPENLQMAQGKYLSLEEARKLKRLDRFCDEHPKMADAERFERLLDLMSRNGASESPGEGERS